MIVKLWDMVNSARTLDEIENARATIEKANISNEEFNDLMNALSYQSREIFRQ